MIGSFFLIPNPQPLTSFFGFPAHDPLIRSLVVARLESARRLAPGRHRMPAAGRLAFAAAMRVIHRVHRHAAIMRLFSKPARLPCFAVRFVLVLYIPYLADGGHAFHRHAANFTGGQLQQGDSSFARNQLGLRTRRTRHLRTLARTEFNVVDHGAGWNVRQRQRGSDQDVSLGARIDGAADRQSHWTNDVPLLAIGVIEPRDARRPVRIILNGRDLSGNAELIALEIDGSIRLLGSAAAETRRDQTLAVASAGALLTHHQRLFGSLLGDFVTGNNAHETPGWRRRIVALHRHGLIAPTLYLGVLGNLLPRLQPDIGFLPIRTIAGKLSATPQFAGDIHRANVGHFYFKKLFYRGLHQSLIGIGRNFKAQRALAIFLGDALFSHDGTLDYFVDGHVASASESFCAAACESSTPAWPSRE